MRILLILFLATLAGAQTDMSVPSPRPHPMVEAALNLNGDSYTPVTGDAHPGVSLETLNWSLYATADYAFAGKSDYGSGHSRSVQADAGYKLSAYWMLLAGGGWGRTYTQQFDKSVSSWRVGAAHDWFEGNRFSARLGAEYFRQFNERTSYPAQAACNNCGNHLAGIVANFWEPSPYTNHHWFLHVSTGVNWFQPSEVPGVTSKAWSFSGGSTMGAVYRF